MQRKKNFEKWELNVACLHCSLVEKWFSKVSFLKKGNIITLLENRKIFIHSCLGPLQTTVTQILQDRLISAVI